MRSDTIQLAISEELKSWVRLESELRRVSMSQVVRDALEQYFAPKREREERRC